jgi:hypothetical protein
MYDLSPLKFSNLEKLQLEISRLRLGGGRQTPKPHKLLLLLAVLDLAEDGLLVENKIYFNNHLTASFEKCFKQFAIQGDWCQPGPPYFHLRSTNFWHHKVRDGREAVYNKLKTSGGGIKRIIENIEYAYLSPDAFSVVNDPNARIHLRSFIEMEISENNMKRIGTIFHESFSFSRPAISTVMSVATTTVLSRDLHATLREQTHLGQNYIKAMPQYARGAGLLTMDNRLTPFGAKALAYDPLLEHQATQWLMHYFLSAPHGPGPRFWYEFVRTRFRSGDEFTKSSLAEQLVDHVSTTDSKELKMDSAISTATVFTGTYTKEDGLNRLGIIEIDNDRCYVLDPEPVPVWAFAVALLDFWQHQFPTRIALDLEELYADGGLTSIFMIGAGRINRYLNTLQQAGMVDVYRVAPPYQVALLSPDSAFALDRLYTSEDDD